MFFILCFGFVIFTGLGGGMMVELYIGVVSIVCLFWVIVGLCRVVGLLFIGDMG